MSPKLSFRHAEQDLPHLSLIHSAIREISSWLSFPAGSGILILQFIMHGDSLSRPSRLCSRSGFRFALALRARIPAIEKTSEIGTSLVLRRESRAPSTWRIRRVQRETTTRTSARPATSQACGTASSQEARTEYIDLSRWPRPDGNR